MRVSNFLLWQIAYAEIWVTTTLWPDFRKRHLFEAILDFQKRERRYGGVIESFRDGDRPSVAPRDDARASAAAVAIPVVLLILFVAPAVRLRSRWPGCSGSRTLAGVLPLAGKAGIPVPRRARDPGGGDSRARRRRVLRSSRGRGSWSGEALFAAAALFALAALVSDVPRLERPCRGVGALRRGRARRPADLRSRLAGARGPVWRRPEIRRARLFSSCS